MEAKVTKLTDERLLQLANSFTSGKESHMTLATAYKYKHSPIRTQIFAIELRDIPLFVASQLVRSHVGVQWYQRSKRTDRGGADFREVCEDIAHRISKAEDHLHMGFMAFFDDPIEEIENLPNRFDRYAPTDLLGIMNAEAIINMSRKRLCKKASKETREAWTEVLLELNKVDTELVKHCVPQCVFRGGICSEPKTCGWIYGSEGQTVLKEYVNMLQRTKNRTNEEKK